MALLIQQGYHNSGYYANIISGATLSSTVAAGHMWLLSSWNMASLNGDTILSSKEGIC